MKTRLTREQMDALAPYEEPLGTAYRSGWARNITTGVFRSLKATYDAVTGRNNAIDGSCPYCVLDLLRKLGEMYFYTKEMEAAETVKPARRHRSAGRAVIVKTKKIVS